MSTNELGGFIRSRRESISAADVGLPIGSRRRTPGLRRAELATLAGLSVDYLTRLEQGRDRHPSAQIQRALADTLRLSSDERVVLARLAKPAHGASCLTADPPPELVRPTVQAILDRLEPDPALVINRLTDVLACTASFERLARPLGLWDAGKANLLRYAFTDARVGSDWGEVADDLLADLRLDASGGDTHVTALINELTVRAGALFADRMSAPLAPARRTGDHRWQHPLAGDLHLAYERLDLADGQRLIVYLPSDDASVEALNRLNGRQPGVLRAVPDRRSA